MVATIRVTGADQCRALGLALKAAGEEGKGLRRELLASMRAAEKPLADAARKSARANLPKAGGLNEWVATSKITARNSLSGRGAGVRLVAKKPGGSKGSHDLEALDAGTFRHPVYGHRKTWVTQSIPAGWWTTALFKASPRVQLELLAAIRITNERIARS